MKTMQWMGAVLVCLPFAVQGQIDEAKTAGKWAGASDFAVTERGPDHRVWTRTEEGQGPSGQILARVHSYVELATGLHYVDPDGRLLESRAEFEITHEGYAVARQGQHRVIVSPILNDATGTVDLLAPDGQRMRSTILGLALRDRLTGKSLLVAQIKEGIVGRQVAPNEILFEDCSDAVPFDVRMVYEIGGFHQDVIAKGAFAPDWLEAQGFNRDSTTLEIWTEMFEAGTPRVQQRVVAEVTDAKLRQMMAEPDMVEDHLDFGAVSIPMGRAYARKAGTGEERSIPVPKRWYVIEGRRFLVESMELAELETLMAALPAWRPEAGKERSLHAGRRPPTPVLARPNGQRMMAARSDGERLLARGTGSAPSRAAATGVVLDYTLTLTGNLTNYTFRGDTTYFLAGNASVYGTGVNFEAGAVLKYASNTTLTVNAPVTWQGSAYRPVMLTAKDDDTLGETISGSSGSPPANGRYAGSALYISSGLSAVTLRHLRVNYAGIAVNCQNAAANELWNAQFSRCGTVAFVTAYGSLSLHNALAQDAGTIVSSYNGSLRGEHVTLRRVGALFSGSPTSCAITNSLFVQVTNWGSGFSSINNATNTSEAGVFQAAGAGSNYLASGSAFRNLGTANLRADVLAELRGKTTWPPVVCSNQPIAGETTLAAQAQRDTDTLDLGYHYEPVDYVVSAVSLAAPLTLAEGVVVGVMGDYGLNLQAGAHVYSGGSPKTLNRVCFYGNVQESPSGSASTAFLRMESAVGSTLRFRFTDFALRPGAAVSPVLSLSTGSGSGELSLRDCQLRGCKLALSPTGAGSSLTVALTNNLVEFSEVNLARGSGVPLTVYLFNNLFRSNAFTVAYTDSASNPTWFIRDNLYHGTPQTYSPSSANVQVSYNAFTTGTANSLGGSPAYTVAADFVTGPLGGYYYAASGSGLFTLINADTARSPAAAGLYHHTVKTAVNTKEGTDTPAYVDIGYHYVAVNATTLPVDTDSDGIPDYGEDADGNGAVSSGETSWQSASDQGLRVSITRPKNKSVVP